MKILILGAGKMGTFFCDILSFDHEVAIFDIDPKRLRFTYNTLRFTQIEEIKDFEPELVINAATVKYTISAFNLVLPYIPENCILSDIASVKTGLKEFYETCGHKYYVSTHPMFGPTFASLSNLSHENAIIISEGDHLGKVFFKDLYQHLHLNIYEYSFQEHDEIVAYSLSIPFVSTFVFSAVMKHIDAPGTTFKRHEAIARGVLILSIIYCYYSNCRNNNGYANISENVPLFFFFPGVLCRLLFQRSKPVPEFRAESFFHCMHERRDVIFGLGKP